MMANNLSDCACPNNYQHEEISAAPFHVFFDSKRRWLRCSPAFAEFLGFRVDELVGDTADKLIPKGISYNQDVWLQFLKEGRIRRFIPLTKKSGEVVGAWIDYRKLNDGCMVAIINIDRHV